MENVKTIGKEYEIYSVSGKVLDSQKHYETRVSGGGGGGYSNQGTGYTAPVSISSTTVIHDNIFIQDKDGKEHALQLSGFNVVSRVGNELTAVWAIKKNKKKGPYVAVVNHTLSEVSFNGSQMLRMMLPHWLITIGALIVTIFLFQSFLLSAAVVVAWYVWGYIKVKEMKKEIEANFNTIAST